MESIANFKAGDTFRLHVTYKDGPVGSEVPTSLTVAGLTPTCQIRNGTVLVATPVVTILDQGTNPGEFTLHVTAANTATWPTKALQSDIKYTTSGGEIISTDTFKIPVIDRVTA